MGGVTEVLATPSITIVDRSGPILILIHSEITSASAASTLFDVDLAIDGVPQNIVNGRNRSNPISGEAVCNSFFTVIAEPAVGSVLQVALNSSIDGTAPANETSLTVVALPRVAGEVAGLVSP